MLDKLRGEEKREYFRIRDELNLKFREVDEYEFQILRSEIKRQSDSTGIDGKLGTYKGDPKDKFSAILEYLISIDRKLSAILHLLERNNEKNHHVEEGRTIDLSASGIRFISPVKPQKKYLELMLNIPTVFGGSIRALAEVVRVEDYEIGGSIWEVAARYVEIGEDERDALISYLLKKEREFINSTKMDE